VIDTDAMADTHHRNCEADHLAFHVGYTDGAYEGYATSISG
jgi:hypothetical protein